VIGGEEAWGATLLRLVLGLVYCAHGYLGLAVAGPAAAVSEITRIGFPEVFAPALAWYMLLVHLVGGALLLVGLWTRAVALLQLPVVLSAVFLVHWQQGFFMKVVQIQAGPVVQIRAGGIEYPLLILVATVAVALLGPGPFALDTRPGARTIELP